LCRIEVLPANAKITISTMETTCFNGCKYRSSS
jgi:hypothetical protein